MRALCLLQAAVLALVVFGGSDAVSQCGAPGSYRQDALSTFSAQTVSSPVRFARANANDSMVLAATNRIVRVSLNGTSVPVEQLTVDVGSATGRPGVCNASMLFFTRTTAPTRVFLAVENQTAVPRLQTFIISEALSGAFHCECADVNRDGLSDAVVLSTGNSTQMPSLVWLRNPGGEINAAMPRWTAIVIYSAPTTTAMLIMAMGDLVTTDGLGTLDFVVPIQFPSPRAISVYSPRDASATTFIARRATWLSFSSTVAAMDVGRVDADALPDIVYAPSNSGERTVFWLRALDSNGTFATAVAISIVNDVNIAADLRILDVDMDGDGDVVVVTSTGRELVVFTTLVADASRFSTKARVLDSSVLTNTAHSVGALYTSASVAPHLAASVTNVGVRVAINPYATLSGTALDDFLRNTKYESYANPAFFVSSPIVAMATGLVNLDYSTDIVTVTTTAVRIALGRHPTAVVFSAVTIATGIYDSPLIVDLNVDGMGDIVLAAQATDASVVVLVNVDGSAAAQSWLRVPLVAPQPEVVSRVRVDTLGTSTLHLLFSSLAGVWYVPTPTNTSASSWLAVSPVNVVAAASTVDVTDWAVATFNSPAPIVVVALNTTSLARARFESSSRMWVPLAPLVVAQPVQFALSVDVRNDGTTELAVVAGLTASFFTGTAGFDLVATGTPSLVLGTGAPFAVIALDLDLSGKASHLVAMWDSYQNIYTSYSYYGSSYTWVNTIPAQIAVWRAQASGNWTVALARTGVAYVSVPSIAAWDVDGDMDGDIALGYEDSSGPVMYVRRLDSRWVGYPRATAASVVPVAQCGYTIACLTATIMSASPCATIQVLLPAGRYTGCYKHRHFDLLGLEVHIRPLNGTVVLDCGGTAGGGGVLYKVTDGGSLTLVNVTVTGATGAPDADGSSMFRAVNSGSRLSFINVTATDCSNTAVAGLAQAFAGYGAVAAVRLAATMTVSHSSFARNVASTFGGALAVIDSSSSLTVSDTTFSANSATLGGGAIAGFDSDSAAPLLSLTRLTFARNWAGGSGGAVYVADRPGSFSPTLTNLTFASNTAGASGGDMALVLLSTTSITLDRFVSANALATTGSGGSLYVTLSDFSYFALTNVVIANAAAGAYGGALAITAPAYELTSSAPALSSNTVDESLAAQFEILSGVSITDATARWGGALFVCDVALTVASTTAIERPHAQVAGGTAYLCDGYLPSARRGSLPAELSAARVTDPSVGHHGYGEVLATPPSNLTWAPLPPADTRPSGMPFGVGAVRPLDYFGSIAADPGLVLELKLDEASGAEPNRVALAIGVARKFSSYPTVSFADTALVVLSRTDTTMFGTPIPILVTIADAGLTVPPVIRAAVSLSECTPGTGRVSSADVELRCALCLAGTYTIATSVEPCQLIPICPINAARLENVNSTFSLTNCTCLPGSYEVSTVGPECADCPIGAVCSGGSTRPVARPGYFGTDDSTIFVQCPFAGACLGGVGSQCASGYSGRLCGLCSPGYFALSNVCRRCRSQQTIPVTLVLVILFSGLVCALIVFNLRDGISNRFAAVMMGLNTLQLCSMFARIELEFSPYAQFWFNAISVLSFNVELTSPECTLVKTDVWIFKYFLTMFLPVFAVAAFLVGSAVVWAFGRGRKIEHWTVPAVLDAAVRGFYQALVLLYLPLMSVALSFFGCHRDQARVWVLQAAPSRVCFNDSWFRMLAPALIFSVLYGVGIPTTIFVLLWRKRKQLGKGVFELRYGFLVARFVSRWFFYEIVHMVVKLGVVLAFTTFGSAISRANGGVVVLAGAQLHLVGVRPYQAGLHNWLAIIMGVSATAILFAGTFASWTFGQVCVLIGMLVITVTVIVGVVLDFKRLFAQDKAANELAASTLTSDDGLFVASGPGGNSIQLNEISVGRSISTSGGGVLGHMAAFASIDQAERGPPLSTTAQYHSRYHAGGHGSSDLNSNLHDPSATDNFGSAAQPITFTSDPAIHENILSFTGAELPPPPPSDKYMSANAPQPVPNASTALFSAV